MRRSSLVVSALLVLSVSAFAAERRPITPEDVWAIQRVAGPALSPDGRHVAYTISTYDMAENRSDSDIWLLDLQGGPPRRLTTSTASDTSPVFSPDGTRIAFLSKRDGDGVNQLYVIPVDGGEAERLTTLPLAVSHPRWLPDGRRLAVLSNVVLGTSTPEETKKAVEAREKKKVKAHVSESRLYRFWDHWLTEDEVPHVFLVDVTTKKVTDLLPGSKRLFSLGEEGEGGGRFDVSPDGKWIAFSANVTAEPYRTLNQDVFLVSTSGGEPKDLTADNPASDADPIFSPDGKTLAYGVHTKADAWPDRTRIALLDLATGKANVLTEAWDVSPNGWAWSRDGRSLVIRAESHARTSLWEVPIPGGTPRAIWKGGSAAGFEVTAKGDVVFVESTISRPAELATVKRDGSGYRRLTTVNDERMSKLSLGTVEEVTFKGAGDEDVQMWIAYPPGFEKAKKYPLVQLVHGGPIGTFGDGFNYRWNPHVFASPGYVVAMVNFHGSSSFGQAWVESILGAHPDKPFTDVMKATDVLLAKGFVDSGRMAAAGASYGGYLVNWIEGHTDRFKCLVSHAGVYSLLGQSASDVTYGRHHSYGGYPFTNVGNIDRWSPNHYAADFKTPMLVTHGERDFRVPVMHGLELYGTLTAKGVPARLVYYPDEHHWILKGQNSVHWYGEVLSWLKRWLG